MSTEKNDLFKQHKDQYAMPKKPILVNIRPALYLTINGQGEPGGDVFQDCIGALYSMAFTIKMTRKFEGKGNYTICKLENMWGEEGMDLSQVPLPQWPWKFMIRTPDCVSDVDLAQAAETLTKKGKTTDFQNVRLETIEEGNCIQMLHIGPYEEEEKSIATMKEFADKQGLTFHGLYHEIYISDPRRIPPERLKTILRQPVRKAS